MEFFQTFFQLFSLFVHLLGKEGSDKLRLNRNDAQFFYSFETEGSPWNYMEVERGSVLVSKETKYSVRVRTSRFYALYTGRLFYSFMLDESICHSRSVGSIPSISFYFYY